jgi:hypothetical protein
VIDRAQRELVAPLTASERRELTELLKRLIPEARRLAARAVGPELHLRSLKAGRSFSAELVSLIAKSRVPRRR